MTKNELIAEVALDFIKNSLDKEPEGSLRFCILGIESSLVRSIAKAVFTDSVTASTVSVKVSPVFDPMTDLPAEIRSEESITHWRHRDCQSRH